MKYRLLTGKHGRFENKQGVVYRKGDEIDLTPEEVKSLGKRVEPVAGTTFRTLPAAAPAKTDTLGLDAANVPDAAFLVAKLDTVDALDAAAAEEKAGKDRKGVYDAIEARRAELEA